MRLFHSWRVFLIAVLCGVVISISFYLFPLDSGTSYANRSVTPLLWPFAFLLMSFQLIPRLFVARIIWEALGGGVLLGHAFVFMYWPAIGAIVGCTKHYLLWGIGVLVVHLALTGLIFYLLSKASIIFL